MCGLTGFLTLEKKYSQSDLNNKITEMTNLLSHRGPDDHGIWTNYNYGIGLGHRRLSILDLSQNGKQPFKSSSGRFILLFNGEIYNFQKIKNEINLEKSHSWKTNSDTEVIVEGFELWGIKNTVLKLSGMFSLAVWDQKNKELSLIRDKFGIKPLYYGTFKKNFLFGSELKSLKAFGLKLKINNKSLNDFLHLSYIPSPNTIYENIYKLKPGTILKLDKNLNFSESEYWSMRDVVSNSLNNQYQDSYSNIINLTESVLLSSTEDHVVSDAPIGSFLSGGIDSTLITSMMQEVMPKKINTFSMGFEDTKYNETKYSKKIAKEIGSNHTEFNMNTFDMIDLIDDLAVTYDEPFADSSQLPTYLLCQLTGNKVKVALSGDGGDEMFGGYNRYIYAARLWGHIKKSNTLKLNLEKWLLNALSEKQINSLYRYLNVSKIFNVELNNPGQSVKKMAHLLDSNNITDLYRNIITVIPDITSFIVHKNETNFDIDFKEYINDLDFLNFMMFSDTKNYLPDDILCKVDRASMRNSLEVRVPFVCEDIFSHAWKIPNDLKVDNKKGKKILIDILKKRIPENLFNRPKAGFALPLDDLIRNNLFGFISETLNQKKITEDGIFNYEEVNNLITSHMNGKNYGHRIWNIFMFQLWFNHWS